MTYVLTGEVKQRGRGAVQGMRTSVPPATRAAQHNYSISGHHKRASSRRLFFSALDRQVTSRSPLKHALASVTQLTTACALHLGAFALSPREGHRHGPSGVDGDRIQHLSVHDAESASVVFSSQPVHLGLEQLGGWRRKNRSARENPPSPWN
ncbi:hypothetical protein ACLKA7_007623 [Drosophila subpalustris]